LVCKKNELKLRMKKETGWVILSANTDEKNPLEEAVKN
jgi:hypothetical protein